MYHTAVSKVVVWMECCSQDHLKQDKVMTPFLRKKKKKACKNGCNGNVNLLPC